MNRTPPRRQEEDEQVARKYNAMVMAGKVRSAVRQATQRAGGCLLDSSEIDVKSGKPVHQVLRDTHPEMRVPDLDDEDEVCF